MELQAQKWLLVASVAGCLLHSAVAYQRYRALMDVDEELAALEKLQEAEHEEDSAGFRLLAEMAETVCSPEASAQTASPVMAPPPPARPAATKSIPRAPSPPKSKSRTEAPSKTRALSPSLASSPSAKSPKKATAQAPTRSKAPAASKAVSKPEGPPRRRTAVSCGNNSGALTVSISGPANNTKCTASLSLSDSGATSCQQLGKIFDEDCDIYEGGLYLNVGFSDPVGTINPDIQSSLDLLGLGNLSYIGLLHLSIGGGGQRVLTAFDFLPNLQAIIGASNPNPSNGFTGAALYLAGSSGRDISSLPSLTRLTDINGTTILQDLALVNLTSGLSRLQIVEGDFVVQNNPRLHSLQGTAQSLTTVLGQVYIANNPQLKGLAGANATTAKPGALRRIGNQLVIGGNPFLTSLSGLENLEEVGGPITISQNNQLSNITALSKYAKCDSNPTSQETPVPIFIQTVITIQAGAPPITCILNNFVAMCSYIANGGCPNPDGTPAVITTGGGLD